MPLARYAGIPFPYNEGLRIDEVMHPLCLLCVGLYGTLCHRRMARRFASWCPRSADSKASSCEDSFVEHQPVSTLNLFAPHEYGFYSNVKPRSRSSTLESSDGAPARRILQTAHREIQWIRQSSCQPVHRNGPSEKFLTVTNKPIGRSKIAVFVPVLRLGWAPVHGELGANPIESVTHSTGAWTLRFLLITLAVTPARTLMDIHVLIRFRPHTWMIHVLLWLCTLSDIHLAR